MNLLKNLFLFLYIFCGIIFFCTESTTSKLRNNNRITNNNENAGKKNGNPNVTKDGLTVNGNVTEVNENQTTEAPSEHSSDNNIKKDNIQGTNNSSFLNVEDYVNIATIERSNPKEGYIQKENGNTSSDDAVADFKNETAKDVTEKEEEGIVEQQKSETAAVTTSDSTTHTKQEGSQRDFIREDIEDYDQYREDNEDDYDEEDDEYYEGEEQEYEEHEKEKEAAELGAFKNKVEKGEEQLTNEAVFFTQKKNDTKDKTMDGLTGSSTDTLKKDTGDDETGKNGFQIKIRQVWNHTNIFRIFEKPVSSAASVNYFRNEIQNDFAFRNGLYFSCTSAYMYNKYVDASKYAYIRLPSGTLVILVTANKLFFQDLIYSSNKYLSIKNKFAYLMNNIIDDLRGKSFFRNYSYQYLFRNDPFALDPTKKLLDFDLLGNLSEVTQMIYTDVYNNEKVSMHKVYGGWFQFLGIMVVNGYYYNDTTKPEPIEVVPYNMLGEFKELLNKTPSHTNSYSYALGLWRDFPNDKFAPWRYSLELLLWDSLNILPNQLPHPAKFVMAYTKFVDKEINKKELDFFSDSDKISFLSTKVVYTKEDLLNWHLLIKKIIKEHRGLDVAIVAADDYYRQTNENNAEVQNKMVEEDKNLLKKKGYVLLLLLNAEFFNDKSLLGGNYNNIKKRNFFKKVVAIIDKIQEILNAIKHTIDPDVESDVKFYNYLNEHQRYKVFNPHILGSIAGITQHLKCEQAKHFKCTRDVSVHYKYGGWFQFGGALYIKNIISIPLQYKKCEILKPEYEQSILLQANSNYQAAGLWRDIPEKDTSRYRYPLQVFLLENPSLNIINIQNAHPFVIIDLINKGLQIMKKGVTENAEDNEVEDSEKENKGIKDEEQISVDTIETEEEAKLVEQKMKDLKKEKASQAASEFNLNFGENVEDVDTLMNFETNKNNTEDVQDTNIDVKGEGMDEDVDETDNTDGVYYEGLEEDKNLQKQEVDLKAAIENPNINLADTLKYVVDSNILEDNEDNDMNEIGHVYDHISLDNDLNLLEGEEKGYTDMQGKFLLFVLTLFLTIFITVAIYIGIKLYERFSNKKVKDKNETVLAFKDKDDIPVVHGMPAPWLKT